MTLIKSAHGWLFGGYTADSWNSNNKYFGKGDSFLFTITNPNNISPTKFNHVSGYRLYGSACYGPTWGAGHDLVVSDNCNTCNSSTNFYSYEDSTGYGKNTFTGNTYFTVSEIEVFSML